MTRCEACGHEFHNVMLREDCPKCHARLSPSPAAANPRQPDRADDGFDTTGMMFGMLTGVPLSPTHGISTGSILGAAMHSSSTPASVPEPSASVSSPSPDLSESSSHSSSDSYSSSSSDSGSSSSSSDSGSSSGGSSD